MQDEESAALDELKEKDKEAELKRQEVHVAIYLFANLNMSINTLTLQLQLKYMEKWMNSLNNKYATGGIKLSICLPNTQRLSVVCQEMHHVREKSN